MFKRLSASTPSLVFTDSGGIGMRSSEREGITVRARASGPVILRGPRRSGHLASSSTERSVASGYGGIGHPPGHVQNSPRCSRLEHPLKGIFIHDLSPQGGGPSVRSRSASRPWTERPTDL